MADTASPIDRERVGAPGLQAPAAIIVDQWGMPHIQAASEHDAFFLQGWNAARDRLWQIDLWRKRGLGLLAASFGPSYADAGSRRAPVPLPRRHGGRVGGVWAGGAGSGARRSSPASTPMWAGARRRGAAAGRVQADREPAGPMAAAGRRAHPQPCPQQQRALRGRPRPGRVRRRPGRRPAAPQARTGLDHQDPRRPRSLRTSRPTCSPTTSSARAT